MKREGCYVEKGIGDFVESPRGGNSDLLCDQFIKGAKSAGHDVEKVRLPEKNIHYCTGCGSCMKTGRCVLSDEMAELLEKMVRADVIVLATPVYFYTMSAQLKTFIDRMCPRYTEVSDKTFYFILTAADTRLDAMTRTVESLRGLTEGCLSGAKEGGILYGLGVHERGEVKSRPVFSDAVAMGQTC